MGFLKRADMVENVEASPTIPFRQNEFLMQVSVVDEKAFKLFSGIKQSCLDRHFLDAWIVKDVYLVENPTLTEQYEHKKLEFQAIGEQSDDIYAFQCMRSFDDVAQVTKCGLVPNETKMSILGSNKYGVHAAKHADVPLKIARQTGQMEPVLIVYKAMLGKCIYVKAEGTGCKLPFGVEDSRCSDTRPSIKQNLVDQCMHSQVYFCCINQQQARHIIPFAVIKLYRNLNYQTQRISPSDSVNSAPQDKMPSSITVTNGQLPQNTATNSLQFQGSEARAVPPPLIPLSAQKSISVVQNGFNRISTSVSRTRGSPPPLLPMQRTSSPSSEENRLQPTLLVSENNCQIPLPTSIPSYHGQKNPSQHSQMTRPRLCSQLNSNQRAHSQPTRPNVPRLSSQTAGISSNVRMPQQASQLNHPRVSGHQGTNGNRLRMPMQPSRNGLHAQRHQYLEMNNHQRFPSQSPRFLSSQTLSASFNNNQRMLMQQSLSNNELRRSSEVSHSPLIRNLLTSVIMNNNSSSTSPPSQRNLPRQTATDSQELQTNRERSMRYSSKSDNLSQGQRPYNMTNEGIALHGNSSLWKQFNVGSDFSSSSFSSMRLPVKVAEHNTKDKVCDALTSDETVTTVSNENMFNTSTSSTSTLLSSSPVAESLTTRVSTVTNPLLCGSTSNPVPQSNNSIQPSEPNSHKFVHTTVTPSQISVSSSKSSVSSASTPLSAEAALERVAAAAVSSFSDESLCKHHNSTAISVSDLTHTSDVTVSVISPLIISAPTTDSSSDKLSSAVDSVANHVTTELQIHTKETEISNPQNSKDTVPPVPELHGNVCNNQLPHDADQKEQGSGVENAISSQQIQRERTAVSTNGDSISTDKNSNEGEMPTTESSTKDKKQVSHSLFSTSASRKPRKKSIWHMYTQSKYKRQEQKSQQQWSTIAKQKRGKSSPVIKNTNSPIQTYVKKSTLHDNVGGNQVLSSATNMGKEILKERSSNETTYKSHRYGKDGIFPLNKMKRSHTEMENNVTPASEPITDTFNEQYVPSHSNTVKHLEHVENDSYNDIVSNDSDEAEQDGSSPAKVPNPKKNDNHKAYKKTGLASELLSRLKKSAMNFKGLKPSLLKSPDKVKKQQQIPQTDQNQESPISDQNVTNKCDESCQTDFSISTGETHSEVVHSKSIANGLSHRTMENMYDRSAHSVEIGNNCITEDKDQSQVLYDLTNDSDESDVEIVEDKHPVLLGTVESRQSVMQKPVVKAIDEASKVVPYEIHPTSLSSQNGSGNNNEHSEGLSMSSNSRSHLENSNLNESGLANQTTMISGQESQSSVYTAQIGVKEVGSGTTIEECWNVQESNVISNDDQNSVENKTNLKNTTKESIKSTEESSHSADKEESQSECIGQTSRSSMEPKAMEEKPLSEQLSLVKNQTKNQSGNFKLNSGSNSEFSVKESCRKHQRITFSKKRWLRCLHDLRYQPYVRLEKKQKLKLDNHKKPDMDRPSSNGESMKRGSSDSDESSIMPAVLSPCSSMKNTQRYLFEVFKEARRKALKTTDPSTCSSQQSRQTSLVTTSVVATKQSEPQRQSSNSKVDTSDNTDVQIQLSESLQRKTTETVSKESVSEALLGESSKPLSSCHQIHKRRHSVNYRSDNLDCSEDPSVDKSQVKKRRSSSLDMSNYLPVSLTSEDNNKQYSKDSNENPARFKDVRYHNDKDCHKLQNQKRKIDAFSIVTKKAVVHSKHNHSRSVHNTNKNQVKCAHDGIHYDQNSHKQKYYKSKTDQSTPVITNTEVINKQNKRHSLKDTNRTKDGHKNNHFENEEFASAPISRTIEVGNEQNHAQSLKDASKYQIKSAHYGQTYSKDSHKHKHRESKTGTFSSASKAKQTMGITFDAKKKGLMLEEARMIAKKVSGRLEQFKKTSKFLNSTGDTRTKSSAAIAELAQDNGNMIENVSKQRLDSVDGGYGKNTVSSIHKDVHGFNVSEKCIPKELNDKDDFRRPTQKAIADTHMASDDVAKVSPKNEDKHKVIKKDLSHVLPCLKLSPPSSFLSKSSSQFTKMLPTFSSSAPLNSDDTLPDIPYTPQASPSTSVSAAHSVHVTSSLRYHTSDCPTSHDKKFTRAAPSANDKKITTNKNLVLTETNGKNHKHSKASEEKRKIISVKCTDKLSKDKVHFVNRYINHKWIINEETKETRWFTGKVLKCTRGRDGTPGSVYTVRYADDETPYIVDHLIEDLREGSLELLKDSTTFFSTMNTKIVQSRENDKSKNCKSKMLQSNNSRNTMENSPTSKIAGSSHVSGNLYSKISKDKGNTCEVKDQNVTKNKELLVTAEVGNIIECVNKGQSVVTELISERINTEDNQLVAEDVGSGKESVKIPESETPKSAVRDDSCDRLLSLRTAYSSMERNKSESISKSKPVKKLCEGPFPSDLSMLSDSKSSSVTVDFTQDVMDAPVTCKGQTNVSVSANGDLSLICDEVLVKALVAKSNCVQDSNITTLLKETIEVLVNKKANNTEEQSTNDRK